MKVLDTDFARSFIRMCNDGWTFGWHEANGGNASYRMRPEEVTEVRSGFRTRPWVSMDTEVPTLAGEFFMITAASSHFRNVAHDPKRTLGIIEIDRTGTCWRECWGFRDGAHPTSELASHLINHEVRKAATQGKSRVIYHCHPAKLAAMTCVVPHDSAVFTRTLWAQLVECALICKEGVEIISWEVPGSVDLAIESAKAMEHTPVVVWPHHGLFVSAETMDDAFGIVHTVEKAAEIFCTARACGMPYTSKIADVELVSFSREYGLELARRNVYAKPYLEDPRLDAAFAKEPSREQRPSAKPEETPVNIPGAFRFPSVEPEAPSGAAPEVASEAVAEAPVETQAEAHPQPSEGWEPPVEASRVPVPVVPAPERPAQPERLQAEQLRQSVPEVQPMPRPELQPERFDRFAPPMQAAVPQHPVQPEPLSRPLPSEQPARPELLAQPVQSERPAQSEQPAEQPVYHFYPKPRDHRAR